MSLDLNKFKVYAVGGYVRDRLLGREAKDHDYVVVGATPDDMIAAGFIAIPATSFPVFHHAITKDEYALARKEKKVGQGYHGFECFYDTSITIEEDLYRRDLTINAMARQVLSWDQQGYAKLNDEIIDPYGGQEDLKKGILHHVSDAFAEDPVRVLRTARFAARYDFDVHDDTIKLMRLVAPELVHVPQERIWVEFEKGLMEESPEKMFSVLNRCGALRVAPLLPYSAPQLTALMRAADDNEPLFVRFVLVSWAFEDSDYERCRIPLDEAKVSKMLFKHSGELMSYSSLTVDERLDVLESFRALNDRNLLLCCLRVLNYLHYNDQDHQINSFMVVMDLNNLNKVNASAIASSCKTGAEIKLAIREARLAVM